MKENKYRIALVFKYEIKRKKKHVKTTLEVNGIDTGVEVDGDSIMWAFHKYHELAKAQKELANDVLRLYRESKSRGI